MGLTQIATSSNLFLSSFCLEMGFSSGLTEVIIVAQFLFNSYWVIFLFNLYLLFVDF